MNFQRTKAISSFLFLSTAALLSFFSLSVFSAPDSRAIHVIQLDDSTINPVTAEYITQAIHNAEDQNAQCLIIKMDTPGGLLSSTRIIVKEILSAQIPVVVYISPSGSRAGSAGVFITYASHIAAMAPSTNIGAAHPVDLGGGKPKEKKWDGLEQLIKKRSSEDNHSKEKEIENSKALEQGGESLEPTDAEEDPMSSKILNDTVAFIKAIAKERNRNVEWAVKSVVESDSITEQEALSNGVVEIIAVSEENLIKQLDGRKVLINGKELILQTTNAPVKQIPMDFRQKLLNILANPNLAYIFMILGFYGLLYEVTHPGVGVPGVLGFIFLVLAFFSLQTLPTNYAGVALIALALILFVAEAYTPGLGLLTLGGVVSMFLGSLLLFDSSLPSLRVSLSLVIAFTATTAGISIFLANSVVRAHRRKVLGGKEGMIGARGTAQTSISSQHEGKVFVHGEIWDAVSSVEIQKGEKVVVKEINGLTLTVQKV